jgi:adenylate cyclase
MVAIPAANLLGAVIVFIFLAWVVPAPAASHVADLTRLNLIVFVVGVPLAISAGRVWALRVSGPIRAWLIAERFPNARERELTLRLPQRLATISGALWAVAAGVFGALNARYSLALGGEITGTVLLGGVATCALTYLLAERIERPTTALALAAGAPVQPVHPGVATRLLLVWVFGTGIAVLGTGLTAAAFLADPTISPRRLAATVIFLSVVALAAGLTTALIAARSIADPILSVRRALAEVERGNVEVGVPVYDGSEIGLLQAGFNRMVIELQERDRLRDLFGRHVGEDVARDALARGVELGGELREAAALFVDVIGSTALAATQNPTVVVETLNRFFALVVEVVTTHGGWVNKFEGDAALCIFGAPTADPAAASRALAASRTLAARLRRELAGVDAAIGVSAGSVVAGNVGAAKRFEYTVIGDAVNEASRLTDLAKSQPSRLLASEAILARANDTEAHRWQLGESITLRGRPAATRIAAPR